MTTLESLLRGAPKVYSMQRKGSGMPISQAKGQGIQNDMQMFYSLEGW